MKVELHWKDRSQQVIDVLPDDKSLYEAKQYLQLDFEPLRSVATDRPIMAQPITARLTKYFVKSGENVGSWPMYSEIDKPDVGPERMMRAVNHFPITIDEDEALKRREVTVEELLQRDMPTT